MQLVFFANQPLNIKISHAPAPCLITRAGSPDADGDGGGDELGTAVPSL